MKKLTRKPRVYIAHPITSSGHMIQNIRDAALAWRTLIKQGVVPFCPGLVDYSANMAAEALDYEEWMSYDYVWLDLCDALLRIPGKSNGAAREVRRANKRGIPVFYTYTKLMEWKEKVFSTGPKSTKKRATPSSPSKRAAKSRLSNGKSTKKKRRR